MNRLVSAPDMASRSASIRLQYVSEHCIKVRNTGPARKESNNLAAIWCKITTKTQNDCREFQVKWCSVSPCPTHWWVSCFSRQHVASDIHSLMFKMGSIQGNWNTTQRVEWWVEITSVNPSFWKSRMLFSLSKPILAVNCLIPTKSVATKNHNITKCLMH